MTLGFTRRLKWTCIASAGVATVLLNLPFLSTYGSPFYPTHRFLPTHIHWSLWTIAVLLLAASAALSIFIRYRTWELRISQYIWFHRRELLDISWPEFLLEEALRQTKSLVRHLTQPTTAAVIAAALVSLLFIGTFWILVATQPIVDLAETYLIIWQVQFGLGAATLPILIFLIRFTEHEQATPQPQVEVLARYTFVFPIQIAVFGLVLVMGIPVVIGPRKGLVLLAYIAFGFSVIATGYAFFRLFQLLYDRTRLEDKGSELLVDRFKKSLEGTLSRRIGANLMLAWIDMLDGRYSYVSLSRKTTDYIGIEAPRPGYIQDVHLGKLSDIVLGLPWKAQYEPSFDFSERPDVADREDRDKSSRKSRRSRPPIVFRRLYGEYVHSTERTLMELRTDAFDKIEPGVIQQRLNDAFNIVSD